MGGCSGHEFRVKRLRALSGPRQIATDWPLGNLGGREERRATSRFTYCKRRLESRVRPNTAQP